MVKSNAIDWSVVMRLGGQDHAITHLGVVSLMRGTAERGQKPHRFLATQLNHIVGFRLITHCKPVQEVRPAIKVLTLFR